MSGSRVFKQPAAAQPGFDRLGHDVVQLLARKYLSISDADRFSRSCQSLWQQVKPILNLKQVQTFLQAVVDDDCETVRALLKNNPWLVLVEPRKDLVIESQFTWQRFYAENALAMTAKRKQSAMFKLLFRHCDLLIGMCKEQEEKDFILHAKTEALALWNKYEVVDDAAAEVEFVIPPFYRDLIQHLINLYSLEPYTNNLLSPATEAALAQFFNMLQPEQAVKLDDYFDIELLCYTACKMEYEQYTKFPSCIRQNDFAIRVIGLIESMVTPRTAGILCEGVYDVMCKQKVPGDYAASLTMDNGMTFYRPARDARSGLGFDDFCRGQHNVGAISLLMYGFRALLVYRNKTRAELLQSLTNAPVEREQSRCVIC